MAITLQIRTKLIEEAQRDNQGSRPPPEDVLYGLEVDMYGISVSVLKRRLEHVFD